MTNSDAEQDAIRSAVDRVAHDLRVLDEQLSLTIEHIEFGWSQVRLSWSDGWVKFPGRLNEDPEACAIGLFDDISNSEFANEYSVWMSCPIAQCTSSLRWEVRGQRAYWICRAASTHNREIGSLTG